MKQQIIKILFVFLMVARMATLYAQQPDLVKIAPEAYGSQYSLMVGTSKTTVLVFPEKITAGGVDLGSPKLIASTIHGVDNILRVKAVSENFPPTNLTVVTTDGKVYSFYVAFSEYPDDCPIHLSKQEGQEKAQAKLTDRLLYDDKIKDCAHLIMSLKPFLKKPQAKSYGVRLSLNGVYSKEDVIFLRLELNNKSPLDFTTDFTRFYIRDQKRMKRTAEQEMELRPIYSFPESVEPLISGKNQTVIIAFRHFTIADHKDMAIQLFEKNGDRHLELKIKGKMLMAAKRL